MNRRSPAAGPATSPTPHLDRLALRLQIEDSFEDATGRRVVTRPDTKMRLLAAMGVSAHDEAEAARRWDELDAGERTELLPPAIVQRAEQPFALRLNLPDGLHELDWRIEREDGGTLQGKAHGHLRLRADGSADLALPPLPEGYHQLELRADGRSDRALLILTPQRCHLPPELATGERIWGISAQLYSLRNSRTLGIGDFTDLQELLRFTRRHGGAVVGLNPLHAMFPDRPEHASPYSPASRLFLNELYIDPDALPELANAPPPDGPSSQPEGDLVDYPAVTRRKRRRLEQAFAVFCREAEASRRQAFAHFRDERGSTLELFAVFQAISEMLAAAGEPTDWRQWPQGLQDAGSPEVAAFAREHQERVTFFAWLQWIADEQLAAASAMARASGMPIGLYRDLAVGADASGAETWSNPGVVTDKARVGAPPDLFNPAGQDWGLPPFDPNRLRAEAYRSFIELLRANMRHAGGLRIDHVMGLLHLYWIPDCATPADGAYVAYPLDDLLGILALESVRNRCLVVGEDLGTVPPGFRERMAQYGVLSYRVVFFEWRADESFKGPDEYPELSLATIGSHDLATLRGWWEGRDNDLKAEHGFFATPDEVARQRERRSTDRAHLLDALRDAGLDVPADLTAESPWDDGLAVAAHAFLARTGAQLAMVQLEDLAGQADQMNLPGSVDQYPNWRRRIPCTLEELTGEPRVTAILDLMAAARSPQPSPAGTRDVSPRPDPVRPTPGKAG